MACRWRFSIYWTVLAAAFPPALLTKDALSVLAPPGMGAGALGWLQLSLPDSRRGHPSLARVYRANCTKRLSLPCVWWQTHAYGSSAGSCGQTALFHAPLDSTSPAPAKCALCSSRSHPAAWRSRAFAGAPLLGPVALLHFISLSGNTHAFCFSKIRVKFRLLKNGQSSLSGS